MAMKDDVTGPDDFTAEEKAILKELARRERARERSQRSGKGKVTSLRVDGGLLAGLKRRAEEEGITVGEALNRAIEAFLNGR